MQGFPDGFVCLKCNEQTVEPPQKEDYLFYRLLGTAMQIPPTTYKELVDKDF